ncbi:YfcC family protein [Natribacillus halophilus]|uniref:Uncharacterized membrane protein YfcC, ion transporter superfamily n=1 Tax=Natribacillus halophilus TaxID=549003 RepID=A0A1G8RZ14_9BACI|nr:TIGR00366 family protein [Natribacillus halophilus]SDJ22206.1 Uncharacterized membrane protein YfcC, ion transporter superfamily [Natribacillus halophilus]
MQTSPKPEEQHQVKKKRTMKLPHIYVILFILAAAGAIMSYIIPAGEYDRVPGPNGQEAIDPDSFTQVEASPVTLTDFMFAIPRGLIDASEIVFFTFIIGGAFMVLRHTGIIEIGVERLARKFQTKSLMIVPVLITIFAMIATIIGTPELSLVYIPVLIPLMISLGYDSMTAAAIALVSTCLGFTAGLTNPGTVGLPQQVSGLELYSGIGMRVVVFVVIVIIGCWYIARYAKKVRANPQSSLVYDDDKEKRELYKDELTKEPKTLSKRQKVAIWTLPIFFGILVFGILQFGWFMMEISGLFIFIGVIVGLIAGLSITNICEAFTEGFREILVGAIVIGLARAISVVMEDGQILDTIVFGLGGIVGQLPGAFSAVSMQYVQMTINFFIPSGSGQALVTMPIMAPLSDIAGVTRQTAVLAYQFGDGFAQILFPTSGHFMAALVIAGVSWGKWVRFFFPLFLIYMAVASAFLIFAYMIQWTG